MQRADCRAPRAANELRPPGRRHRWSMCVGAAGLVIDVHQRRRNGTNFDEGQSRRLATVVQLSYARGQQKPMLASLVWFNPMT